MANEEQVTTPTGFFSNTIKPVFNDDIFSEENLSEEIQKPDLTSPITVRDSITKAAADEDLSLGEFDAAANLATQTLLSDISSQDAFSRTKRDLEFNIQAERGVQFQQGRQLVSDLDAFVQSNRATVVQREYEKELKRQEKLLEQQRVEELQLMAMQLGIDPEGMSRKNLRSKIAGSQADRYSNSLIKSTSKSGSSGSSGRSGSSGGSSGGSSKSGKCSTGFKMSIDGKCIPSSATDAAYLLSKQYDDLIDKDEFIPGMREDYISAGLSSLPYTANQRGIALESASGKITIPNADKGGGETNTTYTFK